MTQRLLYIHETSKESEERARMVQQSGSSVIGVLNYDGDDLAYEARLFEIEKTCDGVWMDVWAKDATMLTRDLIMAAHNAGKTIVGRILSDNQVPEVLNTYFGLQAKAEASS